MQQKKFIAEYDSQKKEKDLENIKEIVAEFERRLNVELRQQKKLDIVEDRNFRRESYQRSI